MGGQNGFCTTLEDYGLAAFLDTTNGQILALWQGVGQLHFGMPSGFRGQHKTKCMEQWETMHGWSPTWVAKRLLLELTDGEQNL